MDKLRSEYALLLGAGQRPREEKMEEGQSIKTMALKGDISLFLLGNTSTKRQVATNRDWGSYSCIWGLVL